MDAHVQWFPGCGRTNLVCGDAWTEILYDVVRGYHPFFISGFLNEGMLVPFR